MSVRWLEAVLVALLLLGAQAVRAGRTISTNGPLLAFTADGRSIQGRVARVSPTIDLQSQSVTVFVQVPNRDGTLGTSGCIYCNNDSFRPSACTSSLSLREQIEKGIPYLRSRYGAERFLVYFQPFTNTYAPVERLNEHLALADVHLAESFCTCRGKGNKERVVPLGRR